MGDYKIKLEDKAAFLNRLKEKEVAVDSFDIKDNKLEGYFEFSTDDPQANEIIKIILKQSPKINKLKEMKQSLTKGQLRQIIREELEATSMESRPMNEFYNLGGGLGQILGMAAGAIPVALLAWFIVKDQLDIKKAKEKVKKITGKDVNENDPEVKKAIEAVKQSK